MSGTLTRALLEAMDPSALGEIASAMRTRAGKIEPEEAQFPHRLRFPAGGDEWTGQASDALQARATTTGRIYGENHARLIDTAGQLEQAEGFIGGSRNTLLQLIEGVEKDSITLQTNDGLFWPCGEPFTVADDFTVKVKPLPTGYPQQIFDAVNLLAAELDIDVKNLVRQLEELSDTWAGKIKQALDLSKLALNTKGQPFEPYDPSKTAHEQAKAIAAGRMDIPSDPKQLHDLWEQLSPKEKDDIYERHHDIGNHGGIPFDPPGDHRGRSYYNERHLGEITEQKQQQLDDLRRHEPPGPPHFGGKTFEEYQKDYADWKNKCTDLQKAVNGYHNVRDTLDRSNQDGRPRYLGFIDNKDHAEISIYNPDYALKHGTLVPGTFSDLTQAGDYDQRARAIMQAAVDASHGQLKENQLSMTEFLNYDRPMTISGIEGKGPWAGDPDPALNGAKALDDLQAGIRASHDDAAAGGRCYNTVFGHSYGTVEVGAAATHGNHLDADAVALLASPGALADSAHGLSLAPNAEVFVGKGDWDPIDVANIAGDLLDTVGLTGSVGLGVSPTEWADAHQMDGGTGDHDSYWKPDNPAMKNMGHILIGDNSHVTPSH
jgi:uncharacterized protein YukE